MITDCSNGNLCGRACISRSKVCHMASPIGWELPEIECTRDPFTNGNQAVVYHTTSGTLLRAVKPEFAQAFQHTHDQNLAIDTAHKLNIGFERIGSNGYYMEMEYLKEYHNLPSSPGLYQNSYFKGFINCLQSLHSQGFTHGDLTRGNILFNGQQIKLIDFGCSIRLKSGNKEEFIRRMSLELFNVDFYLQPKGTATALERHSRGISNLAKEKHPAVAEMYLKELGLDI